MSKTSLSLGNLRAFAILLVVSFHSVIAYVVFKPSPQPFTAPPYAWRAFPIADPAHWFGFDLYCAFQYVALMALMFFLSGLFVWPSLRRKGAQTFILDRAWKIGMPFLLGVGLLMPLAHYPIYSVSALNPSWREFFAQWLSLPFWPSGPLWFLWVLLAFDVTAAALYRFAPSIGERLGAYAAQAANSPGRYCFALVGVAVLAYLPLAAFFKPWDWGQIGPFAFQKSLVLHDAVFFFAGLGIGAGGIESGLLRSDGPLPGRLALWTLAAALTFIAWMLMTALTMDDTPLGIGPFPQLVVVVNLLFVLAAATACFAFAAVVLRFAGRHWPVADELSSNAYAIYLFHYLFVVWLQYALLGLALPAIVKATIVFGVALLMSWAAAIAARRILENIRKIRPVLRPRAEDDALTGSR
ncbi:MAG: acyltransferase [Xanthobacteraceae bacterium]|nr:acyltransferase [Xanthobacteraceae bacterium]